jgi:hypothetical protein
MLLPVSEACKSLFLSLCTLTSCYTVPLQVASHPEQFSADFKKGFIVDGSSSGVNMAAVIVHKALADPLFKDRPLTGQFLTLLACVDPRAIPGKYKDRLLSYKQNANAFGVNNHIIKMMLGAYSHLFSHVTVAEYWNLVTFTATNASRWTPSYRLCSIHPKSVLRRRTSRSRASACFATMVPVRSGLEGG